jgi:hypothetical protein
MQLRGESPMDVVGLNHLATFGVLRYIFTLPPEPSLDHMRLALCERFLRLESAKR